MIRRPSCLPYYVTHYMSHVENKTGQIIHTGERHMRGRLRMRSIFLLQQKGPDWVVGQKPGIIRYCGHEPGDGEVIEDLWTNDQGHL